MEVEPSHPHQKLLLPTLLHMVGGVSDIHPHTQPHPVLLYLLATLRLALVANMANFLFCKEERRSPVTVDKHRAALLKQGEGNFDSLPQPPPSLWEPLRILKSL